MGMAVGRHTCGCVGTHRGSPQPVWALRGFRSQSGENRAPTSTPSPTASRAKGGGVLRGNSDDFLEEEMFVLSSSLFPFFPVWRILGEEAAGRGLGPENPKSSLFCWQEVKSSQASPMGS